MFPRSRSALALGAVLTLAFALHAAGAQEASGVDLSTTMTNDEVGFTIAYPPTWGVTTYPDANQVDFDDGPTFVIVDAYELDALPVREPADLLEFALVDLETFVSDLEVTTLPDRRVGGLDAVGIDYTGADEDLEVRGVMLVMADERYAYVINFEAPAELFDANEPTFEAMLESFRTGLAE